MACSASAVMVNAGLTPGFVGSAAASQTIMFWYPNTRCWWSMTPVDASAPTPIIYIEKADAKASGLRTRLRQYARRGSSHQGGRSICQLADHAELLVAWVETPGEIAEDVEISYRAAFADRFGGWPFANWKR